MLVLAILGTRPDAIKMAPVIKELRRHASQLNTVVCSTAQHREMLDQVLELFAIRPDVDLNVMQPNQSLAALTANLTTALDNLVQKVQPDWILAQGDTTTTMVAGLVAFYRRVKFGHVEAGLRTGNLHHPFPEEINRRIADLVADLYFAPTVRAREVLVREGVAADRILLTGNTVVDALLDIAARPVDPSHGILARLHEKSRVVLVTAHRRESFGEPFRELCQAIRDLAVRFADQHVQFLYPVHLNPNVQGPVREILSGLPNVHLLPPLGYLELVQVMKRSTLILTDSGGLQEEAPTLRVPVLVMRMTTERPEGIDAGVAKLVGTKRASIVQETTRLLTDPAAHATMATGQNPYGDGQAAVRIVSALLGKPMEIGR